MLRHLLRRLLYAIPTLWVMVSVIFLLSRVLPGTYGEQQILHAEESYYSKGSQQSRSTAYQQLLSRTNQQLPLFYFSIAPLARPGQQNPDYTYLVPDLNWHGTANQYHLWIADLFRGSLGNSFVSTRPVTETIWEAAANTFGIIIISLVATVLLSLLTGVRMVYTRNAAWRKLLLASLIVVDSLPLFIVTLLLLLLFANPDVLQIFPVYGLGYQTISEQNTWITLFINLPYLILPIICLVLAELPYLTNQFYSSLTGTMQADYIKTAHAKGLKPLHVITKHAFRNALLPTITVLSELIPTLVAGTVIIETIFAIPGIGRLLVTSVLARDFPVIVGIVVIIALVKMTAHVLADLFYTLADPRIRHTR